MILIVAARKWGILRGRQLYVKEFIDYNWKSLLFSGQCKRVTWFFKRLVHFSTWIIYWQLLLWSKSLAVTMGGTEGWHNPPPQNQLLLNIDFVDKPTRLIHAKSILRVEWALKIGKNVLKYVLFWQVRNRCIS